jgi:hypothetical protein
VERPGPFRFPDPQREAAAGSLLTEEPCVLNPEQRRLVEETIAQHCAILGWHLHAVNCRTKHVHVVVIAPVPPKVVRDQLKAWCTRQLKERQRVANADPSGPVRTRWWTERGSERWIAESAHSFRKKARFQGHCHVLPGRVRKLVAGGLSGGVQRNQFTTSHAGFRLSRFRDLPFSSRLHFFS